MDEWDAAAVEDEVELLWATAADTDPDTLIMRFGALRDRFPGDPRAWFEYASSLDYAGQESEAVPAYEHAFAEGLEGDRRRRGLVQYSSSLRNIGRVDEAVEVLQTGGEEFPGDPSIAAFLALALASAGRPTEGVALLLDLCVTQVDDLGLRQYDRALRGYADELRVSTSG